MENYDYDKEIQEVIEHTEVLRPPRRRLSTFGTTNIYYYLVTEPVYAELTGTFRETVVREGRVIAERPRIVTPRYLVNLFEGFEHGRQYAEYILRRYGPSEPGLLYRYKNEPKEMTIVSSELEAVVQRLSEKIDKEGDPLAAIIKGVDKMWDVSVMKFIHDLTRSSLPGNIMDLGGKGLLDIDSAGIPREARLRIEELFEQVRRGEVEPSELKLELDRWGLFEEYEDRFFTLFRKR
jgi:hypothetical protein